MAYAAAVLEENGYFPRILDAIAERISLPLFVYKTQRYRPDMIVLETSTPSFIDDLIIVKTIRESLGKTVKIALSGPNQLMLEDNFMADNPEVDFVFQGEYEFILLELVQCLEKEEDLSGITGLIFRRADGTVVRNAPRPLLENLDDLPWPSRHQLPMMEYYDDVGGIPQPNAQVWASRGCPFQCIFCLWPQLVYGSQSYRVRSPKSVVDEMEWLVNVYGYKSIYFDDDTFNIGKSRMLEFCRELQSRNFNTPWGIMARADTMDREILIAMRDAGLYSVKYGVESADQSIVDGSGKNLDLKKVVENVGITRDLGIQFHLTFTFGLPGETWETARETIDLALEMDPQTIQFSICTPMPGSKYYNMLEEKGHICSTDWSSYTGFDSAVARTEELSSENLQEILKEAYTRWDAHRVQRTSIKERLAHTLKEKGKQILEYLEPEK